MIQSIAEFTRLAVLVMTEKLKKDLPKMLKEHSAVIGGLKKLIAEAKCCLISED